MSFFRTLGVAALLATTALAALADDTARPTIRAAVLEAGTVNWELTVLSEKGLDAENGFTLAVQPYASNDATRIATEGGEADVFVADWIWVARQNADGKDYRFIPYSTAVGGLVVPGDSPAQTLADLKGQKIGIAGGPLDKSWLILRAYAQQEYGMDLAAETEQVYGAPPLIFKSALGGEMGGAINFWHFLAKMKAAGMRSLVDVQEAATALGLDPDTPLLGYVVKQSFIDAHPEVVAGFARASQDAKTLMAEDDALWDIVRPQMNAQNDAQFAALRDDFRSGIPESYVVDEAAADKLLKLMGELGGEELVGKATSLPAGLFYSAE